MAFSLFYIKLIATFLGVFLPFELDQHGGPTALGVLCSGLPIHAFITGPCPALLAGRVRPGGEGVPGTVAMMAPPTWTAVATPAA